MKSLGARKAVLLLAFVGAVVVGFVIWRQRNDPLSDFGSAVMSRGDTIGVDFGGAQAHLTTIIVAGLSEAQVRSKLSARGLRHEIVKATVVSTPSATYFFSGDNAHEWYVDPHGRSAVLVEPSYPGGPIKLTKYTDLNYLEHVAFQLGSVKLQRLWTPYDSYSDLSRRQPSPP